MIPTDEEIIELAKKNSQKTLFSGDNVVPICLIFTEEGNQVIALNFNNDNKEVAKQVLKKRILTTNTKKYALIMDTKATQFDKKTGKIEVSDMLVIQIYTPNTKIFRGYFYGKDKKLKMENAIEYEGRKDMSDEWDVWGKGVDLDDKLNKQYQKFREENKDKYE